MLRLVEARWPCTMDDLSSADTTTLKVPSTHRATFGDCAFLVAAVRAWNSLPPQTWACSFLTFGGRPSLAFFVSRMADLALSTVQQLII